jgi:DNA polymerase III sliding clamp (beta) subunit (PCNA family)
MDKITSKSSIRPELSGIYFTPDKMVATDSFRLIEVRKEIGLEGEPRIVKVKGFKGKDAIAISADNIVKDGEKLIQGEATGGSFPDYERIFADASEKPRFTMLVNAKYLAELAAEVDAQAADPFHKIQLDFYEPMKPLLITAKGEHVEVRALLSPMNR